MSGYSYGTICPNCGKSADAYSDRKPFDYPNLSCLHCGLQTSVHIDYLNLEDLNDLRIDCELEPLEKLPIQNEIK